MTTALTVGTFDILHPGHVELFADCRRLAGPAGQVVAGINTDEFVERYRGKPPVMPDWQRGRLVAALSDVDSVVFNGQPNGSMFGLLQNLDFGDYLVIGSDWLERDYLGQIGVSAAQLAALKVSLVFSPRRAGGPTSSAFKAAM